MDNKDMFLPRHLRNIEHIAAFEETVAKRFGDIDMSPCMMYLVDTCSVLALPFLADQFGCLRTRDYQIATTDDERRRIIKEAVKTRAYMGTVWVIKNAMEIYGYDPAWLEERCDEGTDPVHGWAHFKINVPDGFVALSGVSADDLSQLIMQYKPARCKYLGAFFDTADIVDEITDPTEAVAVSARTTPVDAFETSGFKYNGAHKYDGSMKYRSRCEVVVINIV